MASLRFVWAFIAAMVCGHLLMADGLSLSAGLPFGGIYVPGAWTPLRVEVRNATDGPVNGTVRLKTIIADAPEFRADVTVAPRSRYRTMMWVQLPWVSQKQVANLAIVTLLDKSGSLLARSDMAGTPVVKEVSYSGAWPTAGYVIWINGDDPLSDDWQASDVLADVYRAANDSRVVTATVSAPQAPRDSVVYRNVYAVVLNGGNWDVLDTAQRNALLEYAASGGVLLVCAPQKGVTGTWLEGYLPVRLVGSRLCKEIRIAGEKQPRQMKGWMPCAEAVAGDGKVFLADGDFVYAAAKPVGFGQVGFTSFPTGAFAAKNETAVALWRKVLMTERAGVAGAGTRLQSDYGRLLEPMLGKQATSWNVAAIAVTGFVLLVLVVQFVWRGPKRPMAFAVGTAGAVLISIGFAGVAAVRNVAEPLQEANLRIVDVGQGGAVVREYSALAGPGRSGKDAVERQVTAETAVVWPEMMGREAMTLRQWPLDAQGIAVRPDSVPVVMAGMAVQRDKRAELHGQFGENGLELRSNNQLGQMIMAGQLVWGESRLLVGNLGEGESSVRVDAASLRPAGEFTSGQGIASQDEQQKAQFLRTALTGMGGILADQAVYGWAAQWPAIAPLHGVTADRSTSQNLVRIPVVLTETPAGSKVRLDGCFNRLDTREAQGLPFDPRMRKFMDSSIDGKWPLAIAPPDSVKRFVPQQAHLVIDLSTAQHRVVIRRGKRSSGEVLADWSGQVGRRDVNFACQSGDYDEQGRLWLNMDVTATSKGSFGVPPRWHLEGFMVDMDGSTQGSGPKDAK